MIHHSSKAPVLIKKISLKIWSLRDEIEGRIQEKIATDGEENINIDEIKGLYSKNAPANNVVELKSGAQLDDSEDEMARAMREASGEEAPLEPSEENPSTEESNVVELNSGDAADSNIIEISLTPPPISDEKIARGKTVLSEITMDKMFFFTNKAFTEGQSVVIQFCIPKMFIMNADVLYCRPFNLKSRIISQNSYNYRVLIRFSFLKAGERALLRQFIQSIEPDLSKMEESTTAASGDGDSGFSELDDLGF